MIESKLLENGISRIAGVDEAGRGACAGPLVIAAVILKDLTSNIWSGIRDSKELSAAQREEQFKLIVNGALEYSIIEIEAKEIDAIGLQRANIEGMRRAVLALSTDIEYVLTDGYSVPGLSIPNLAVVKGDQVALTISAASILAKVHRDKLMITLEEKYPGYGLSDHKGYGTKSHQLAMEKLGVTAIHRRSYSNVNALINR